MLPLLFFYFKRRLRVLHFNHNSNLLKRRKRFASYLCKFVCTMKSKEEIVQNWLPRYTGEKLENFGKYILLTNFSNYVKMFAFIHDVAVIGEDRPMQCATANGITIINFGMGSPGAATVMDLLSAVTPEAVLFLGKCG